MTEATTITGTWRLTRIDVSGPYVRVSEPDDLEYNGQHQESPVIVTRVDELGSVLATLTEGVDYSLSYEDDVNAGEDSAKVTVSGIGSYEGSVERSYSITPAAAVILVNDSSKTYGEDDPVFTGAVALADSRLPLYTNVLTGGQDTLGDISYTRDNSDVENVGEYPEVLDASVANANPNYTYTVQKGDFSIIRAGGNAVTITTEADNRTKVYDGAPITIDAQASMAGSTLLYTTTPQNEESWSTDKPTLTNVGSLTIYVKATNPNYEDSAVVSATVQVTPAPLVVTTGSAAKVYDGTALTSELIDVTGFVNGEIAPYWTTGTITVPGRVDNTYVIDWESEEATALESNYAITSIDLGELVVTKQSVDPTDPTKPDPDNPDPEQPIYTGAIVEFPDDTQYNGSEQRLPVVVTDAAGNTLNEGVDYTVSYSDDVTNVGTVIVTVTGIGNYGGETQGSYRIIPAPLTITTPSASKVYDGTALTAGPAQIEGIQGDDVITATATGSQTAVGQSTNGVDVTWNGLLNNYDVTYSLGTLTVFPQSIDPTDPDPSNPEPGDPSPTDPDPEDPDQPFYTGVTVDSPVDVPYNGTDQTWAPTVTASDGTVLVAGRDYTVEYSTTDRTNVTGTITVTITGTGNYAGTVTRTYQITPLTITVTPDDHTKYVGAADPSLTSSYSGYLEGEVAGWTGALTREPGEAVGTYAITQGDLALADNPEGNFLASNYRLVVLEGTLTIVAAPVNPGEGGEGGEGGTTPTTPTTPGGGAGTGTVAPTPGTPAPATTLPETGADDATDEETLTDDETPLANRDVESIEDDNTPLAAGDQHDNCWVHWLILVGMILTAVYFVGVAIRRRKFSADLLDYEDKVLGNDRSNA